MNEDQTLFPDPAIPLQAQQAALERRRALARSLILQSQQQAAGPSGELVSGIYVPNHSGLGAFANAATGSYMNATADREAQDMAAKQAAAQSSWQTEYDNAPDEPTKQRLLSRARNNGLRFGLEQQFRKDNEVVAERTERTKADRQARIDAAEQRSQDVRASIEQRREAAKEAADLRRDLAKDAADLRRDMARMQGSGNAPAGLGKPPSGYRWNDDGNLEPIKGGPADKKPESKPLTAKQLETQRGFMDLESSLSNYDKMLAAYDPRGGSATSPTQRAALEGAYTDLQMKLKTLYELGAPQAGDLKLLAQSIPSPVDMGGTIRGAAFGSEPFKAKNVEIRKLLVNSRKNFETQMKKETPAAAGAGAAPAAAGGGAPVPVADRAAWQALPPGTRFVMPDGKTGVK